MTICHKRKKTLTVGGTDAGAAYVFEFDTDDDHLQPALGPA